MRVASIQWCEAIAGLGIEPSSLAQGNEPGDPPLTDPRGALVLSRTAEPRFGGAAPNPSARAWSPQKESNLPSFVRSETTDSVGGDMVTRSGIDPLLRP